MQCIACVTACMHSTFPKTFRVYIVPLRVHIIYINMFTADCAQIRARNGKRTQAAQSFAVTTPAQRTRDHVN